MLISLCPDLAILRPDGENRSVPPGKPALVLARLALVAGRAYSRDHLVECVWPECERDVGRPRLRFALTVLRNEFCLGDALAASKNEVGLDWSTVDTDVEIFRRQLKRAKANAPPDSVDVNQANSLCEACDTLRGELAEQLTAPWLEAHRQEIRELRVEALRKAAALLGAAGHFTAAEKCLRDAIAADRLREGLHAELIGMLHHAGRTAEAIAQYEEFRRGLQREMGLAPSDALTAIARDLVRTDPSLTTRSRLIAGNEARVDEVADPAPIRDSASARFFGRDALMSEALSALEEYPVVTLTGLGGVGKTRLATEMFRARRSAESRFVDLSDAQTEQDVLGSLLNAYEVSGPVTRGVRRELIHRLTLSGDLLVLDNCEQVLEPVRELVSAIGMEAPNVRILATSRKRIGVSGERVLDVPGLHVPDDESDGLSESLADSPSVRLFVLAARAANRDFALTAANAKSVARLVRAVDGLPLSIELAAARLRVMPLDEILARLGEGLAILSSSRGPARHRSVVEIVEWSVSGLSKAATRLLRRLAVFAGGWSVPAIRAAAGQTVDSIELVDALDELIENSLVSRMPGHRFRLLENIRLIALQRLVDEGEEETAREAHLRAYLALYETRSEEWASSSARVWRTDVEADFGNLRAALKWAALRSDADQPGERLACAIWRYWIHGAYIGEGLLLLRGLLEAHPIAEPNAVSAEFLAAIGLLEMRQSNLDAATATEQRALEMARAVGAFRVEIDALINQADILIMRRRAEDAECLFREALLLAEGHGETRSIGSALQGIGRTFLLRNEHLAARPYLERALAHARATGADARLGPFLNNLADNLVYTGDLEAARAHLLEAAEIEERCGNRSILAIISVNLCLIALEQGDMTEARRRQEAALNIQRRIGEPRRIGRSECRMGLICMEDQEADAAESWFNSAIATLDGCGERYEASLPRLGKSLLKIREGDLKAALVAASEALEVVVRDTSPTGTATALHVAAALCVRHGQFSEGAVLLGAGENARRRRNLATPRIERPFIRETDERARASLADRFDALREAGAQLTESEALGLARRTVQGFLASTPD